MTSNQQVVKNFALSEKLAEFFSENINAYKKTMGTAVIPFSWNDTILNKQNEQLASSLLSRGEVITKAKETKDQKSPWKFTTITP